MTTITPAADFYFCLWRCNINVRLPVTRGLPWRNEMSSLAWITSRSMTTPVCSLTEASALGDPSFYQMSITVMRLLLNGLTCAASGHYLIWHHLSLQGSVSEQVGVGPIQQGLAGLLHAARKVRTIKPDTKAQSSGYGQITVIGLLTFWIACPRPARPSRPFPSLLTSTTVMLHWRGEEPSEDGGAARHLTAGLRTRYTLRMRDKQGNIVNHQTGTLNSYVLDELTPGATYTFEVEAANQSGASGFSHVSRSRVR